MNRSAEEVMPQESPPVQAEVTESPLTSLPRQHQDKRGLEEVGRAADDQNPDVRTTSHHSYTYVVMMTHAVNY